MAGRFGPVSCVLLLVNCVQILMSTPSILKAPLKGETAMQISLLFSDIYARYTVEFCCETYFLSLWQLNINKNIQIPFGEHTENIICSSTGALY
jgi:hypothetical protein